MVIRTQQLLPGVLPSNLNQDSLHNGTLAFIDPSLVDFQELFLTVVSLPQIEREKLRSIDIVDTNVSYAYLAHLAPILPNISFIMKHAEKCQSAVSDFPEVKAALENDPVFRYFTADSEEESAIREAVSYYSENVDFISYSFAQNIYLLLYQTSGRNISSHQAAYCLKALSHFIELEAVTNLKCHLDAYLKVLSFLEKAKPTTGQRLLADFNADSEKLPVEIFFELSNSKARKVEFNGNSIQSVRAPVEFKELLLATEDEKKKDSSLISHGSVYQVRLGESGKVIMFHPESLVRLS